MQKLFIAIVGTVFCVSTVLASELTKEKEASLFSGGFLSRFKAQKKKNEFVTAPLIEASNPVEDPLQKLKDGHAAADAVELKKFEELRAQYEESVARVTEVDSELPQAQQKVDSKARVLAEGEKKEQEVLVKAASEERTVAYDKYQALGTQATQAAAKLEAAQVNIAIFQSKELQEFWRDVAQAKTTEHIEKVVVRFLRESKEFKNILSLPGVAGNGGQDIVKDYVKQVLDIHYQDLINKSAAEGDKPETVANIAKIKKMIDDLQVSLEGLENELQGLTRGYVTSDKLEAIEKVLVPVILVINTILLVGEGAALALPAIMGARLIVVGGTLLLVGGIASALIICTYLIIHTIKEKLKEKESQKQTLDAAEIIDDVLVMKVVSKALLANLCLVIKEVQVNVNNEEAKDIVRDIVVGILNHADHEYIETTEKNEEKAGISLNTLIEKWY